MVDVRINQTWKEALREEFEQPYFVRLIQQVRQAYATGKVYPSGREIFRAFDLCPFDQVKVVLLGQDPYHGPGQANGLSFSVHKDVDLPPSLRNVYTELSEDLGVSPPTSGDLTHWAEQGVLLLNASLTVQAGRPMSHAGIGWNVFTDHVIKLLSSEKEHLVFILWGAFAGTKALLVDESKHLVIRSAHPSPLSAYRGFFGSKPFSRTNYYLLTHSQSPIRWVDEPAETSVANE